MTYFAASCRPARRAALIALAASAVAVLAPAALAGQEASPSSRSVSAPSGGPVIEKVLLLDQVLPQTRRSIRKPSQNAPSRPPRNGDVTLLHFTHQVKNLKTGDIQAEGGGQLVYTEPDKTDQKTTITADRISYNEAHGQIEAPGNVRVERDEGTFIGTDLSYNLKSHAGVVSNAILETDYVRVRGKKITANGDSTYTVEQGSFTTCIHTQPDYLIRAKHLLISLDPERPYVSARGVTFYAGRTRLIGIPFPIRRPLKTTTSNAPIPLPGYDKTDGVFVRVHDAPILDRHQALDFDARINARRLPTGAAAFETDIAPSALNAPPPRTILPILSDPLRGILEQLTPPTYTEYTDSQFVDQYAPRSVATVVLQNDQFVYNRRRTNLTLTRFPEVGLRFINLLGNRGITQAKPALNAQGDKARVVGSTESVLQRVPNAPFLLNLYTGIGGVHEDPTGVTAGRIATRLSLATQPLIVGRRLSLRAGLSNWFNGYTTGSFYELVSPEIGMDYVPTRTSRFGAAYRYLRSTGRTPFLFDRRDIRNELRLQYQVGGRWAFGIESKIDLDRSAAYDSELALLRNFDCMQIGFAYRTRSQQFSLIFNLLPPTSDRLRRMQPPLQFGGTVHDAAASLGLTEDDLLFSR